MTNKLRYDQIFIDTFSIEEGTSLDELEYNSIPDWDSIGHMELIGELEDIFDISMEMDNIIDFSSYEKGLEILRKYDVDL